MIAWHRALLKARTAIVICRAACTEGQQCQVFECQQNFRLPTVPQWQQCQGCLRMSKVQSVRVPTGSQFHKSASKSANSASNVWECQQCLIVPVGPGGETSTGDPHVLPPTGTKYYSFLYFLYIWTSIPCYTDPLFPITLRLAMKDLDWTPFSFHTLGKDSVDGKFI